KGYNTSAVYRSPCEMQKSLGNVLSSKCDDDGGGCQNQYWNYGPLINARWNQWNGFNNTLENLGCSSTGGRPPSGCVATAIGQVMRYHQHPSGYNWGAMPLTNLGSNSVSQLLEDIGDAVNMDYSCDGSGAQTADGATALRNTFGYSTASFGSWNHTTTKNEIRAGRPVILAGHTDKSCFLWWCGYQNGHAWVCEGYRSTFYCDIGVQTTHYYMNWGWGGTYNGYYAYNSWKPNGYDFKYNRRMIYNIKP
ncbi:MAG: C10 family peptidase, partial [Flavobacteriaceae bacterium]